MASVRRQGGEKCRKVTYITIGYTHKVAVLLRQFQCSSRALGWVDSMRLNNYCALVTFVLLRTGLIKHTHTQ